MRMVPNTDNCDQTIPGSLNGRILRHLKNSVCCESRTLKINAVGRRA
jgi:hypothetical protein